MSDVKKYLLEDIEKLEHDDICKLYKYVRRYLIANTGMVDPLERSDNNEYMQCKHEEYIIRKNILQCRNCGKPW